LRTPPRKIVKNRLNKSTKLNLNELGEPNKMQKMSLMLLRELLLRGQRRRSAN